MEAASVHHLQAVPDGEIPADGPQTMAEALQHIRFQDSLIEELQDKLDGVTGSFTSAKGEITKLRRALNEQRKEESNKQQVREVLRYWRDKVAPKAEIAEGDDRWEKVRDRLGLSKTKQTTRIDDRDGGGFTVEELKLVVDGALASPFHCGDNKDGKKYLDAVSIYGSTTKVFKHVARARAVEERALDERLAAFFEAHPNLVYDAIVRERQVEQLKVLAPCAFEPKPSELREVGFEEFPS